MGQSTDDSQGLCYARMAALRNVLLQYQSYQFQSWFIFVKDINERTIWTHLVAQVGVRSLLELFVQNSFLAISIIETK